MRLCMDFREKHKISPWMDGLQMREAQNSRCNKSSVITRDFLGQGLHSLATPPRMPTIRVERFQGAW